MPLNFLLLRTQELSETVKIRGANADVGILGVVAPFIDGVFSPFGWLKVSALLRILS